MLTTRRQRTWLVLLVAPLVASGAVATQSVTQPALKAAFLYNFARFTEWPAGAPAAALTPLTLCVVDDTAVEDALAQLVKNTSINGRAATVSRGVSGARLRSCHLLYLGEINTGRAAAILDEIQGAPILTVSSGDDFVRGGGMVGLFLEDGRMRFTVNPDAAQRAGVRLSSRMLTLAKILKDDHHDRP